MPSLLQDLLGRVLPKPPDTYVEQMVLRAVVAIDPRLKSFGNYPRAYRASISTAIEYARQLAESLPECIELDPAHYADEPLLHALFSDVGIIRTIVRDSEEIQEYCRKYGEPERGEVFSLMGMCRQEKTVFGREMDGDVIKQDVRQTLISFESHTLYTPTADKAEFREKLVEYFFDYFIGIFAKQMKLQQAKKKELEMERDTLIAQSRMHASQAGKNYEEKLAETRKQLEELSKSCVLTNYAKWLKEYIENLEQEIYLEEKTIPIDMRGVMRESNDRLSGRFVFHDLKSSDSRIWSLCPVKLPVAAFKLEMKCDRENSQ